MIHRVTPLTAYCITGKESTTSFGSLTACAGAPAKFRDLCCRFVVNGMQTSGVDSSTWPGQRHFPGKLSEVPPKSLYENENENYIFSPCSKFVPAGLARVETPVARYAVTCCLTKQFTKRPLLQPTKWLDGTRQMPIATRLLTEALHYLSKNTRLRNCVLKRRTSHQTGRPPTHLHYLPTGILPLPPPVFLPALRGTGYPHIASRNCP